MNNCKFFRKSDKYGDYLKGRCSYYDSKDGVFIKECKYIKNFKTCKLYQPEHPDKTNSCE